MKKEMLLLMALGCLAPMGIDAICFRYVDGPKSLNQLKVEADETKIGSNLPTLYSVVVAKGKGYSPHGNNTFTGKTVYVTVKEYTSGLFTFNPILVHGVKLDSKAAYDISIDDNRKVTFTKVSDSCEGKKTENQYGNLASRLKEKSQKEKQQ